ncbi:MAG TPA: helix-turn-helix domain-containing protein [Trebonia sp.]|jgi:excisionase family DNA binding protein
MNAPPDLSKYDEYLTVPEVAAILRVSKMTVYRMVHREDIRAVRVGRSFRVPDDEVQRILRDGIPVTSAVAS